MNPEHPLSPREEIALARGMSIQDILADRLKVEEAIIRMGLESNVDDLRTAIIALDERLQRIEQLLTD